MAPAVNGDDDAIVGRLGHSTFGLWFPVFRWLCGRVPPVFLARLGAATVERAIWARENVREAVIENTSHVLGLPASDRRVEETALAMLSCHSRLWIDLLRFSGREDVDAAALLARTSGEEQLAAAHRAGRGAILLTAHVGNFEIGGLFLRTLGISISAVYAPDPSPVVEAHREEARRRIGVEGIPVTSSPFAFVPILRALKEGRFVAMQGDRDVSGTGMRLPFLGRTASFPVGPFRLAAVSGAPLFPVFVLQGDDGRYETVVEPALRLDHAGARHGADEALRPAMESFVGTLERTIRTHPTQWYLFRRFWD